MASWQDTVEGLDRDEALGVFQGLLSALGQGPGQAIEGQSQGEGLPAPHPGGLTGALSPVPQVSAPTGAPPPRTPPAGAQPPPPTVIGSMTQGPQPQNPFAEAAAGTPPGTPAGSPPPTPPPGAPVAGGGGLSGPPNSKLQQNTTDPVAAQNPIEAPGVVPTYPQPGQAEYQQGEANDPVRQAKQISEQNAETLQRGTRAQTALSVLRAIMGIAGAGMGMAGGREAGGVRRAGTALAIAGSNIPTGLPGAIAGARIGQRQQAFQDLLAARGDVRSQEYLDQQKRAMDLNEQRFGLQSQAQTFGQEQTLREEERAQAAETRTQGEYELQRRRQDKDSQESRDARARFMAEFATIPQNELPAWQQTAEFAAYAANEATAEQIEQWTQTMQPIHQRRKQESRRGRGGGGEGGGRLGPWELEAIERYVAAGGSRAAATDAAMRGRRYLNDLLQQTNTIEGRQRTETAALQEDMDRLAATERALGRVKDLTGSQAFVLQAGLAGGTGPAGGAMQSIAAWWEGLSPEQRLQVDDALVPAVDLLNRIARDESGAAIAVAEWPEFRARVGMNLWVNNPVRMKQYLEEYAELQRLNIQRRQRGTAYGERPGSEVDRAVPGSAAEGSQAPTQYPVTMRRMSGEEREQFTAQNREQYDRAYAAGFRARPGGG